LFVKESDEILVENYKESIPSLLINDEKTDFYEMTIEDFFMVNYDPIKPQLKLELGI
jgi:thymidylate synthase